MINIRPLIYLAVSCAVSSPAWATTVNVTNTNNTGSGSLRSAITSANATANTTVAFHIPTSDPNYSGGVFTIKPTTALPTITQDGTVIDGSTQTSFTGDTNPSGPEIILDGSLAPAAFGSGGPTNGLTITSPNCTVKNLVIDNFIQAKGIVISGSAAEYNTVLGCYFGTNKSGSVGSFTQSTGISIEGAANNLIGGTSTSARNIISGNNASGVFLSGGGTTGNSIQGNYIGVDATGTSSLGTRDPGGTASGTQQVGVYAYSGAQSNTIGGAATGATNVISGNFFAGIRIFGPDVDNNVVTGNYIGTNSTSTGDANAGLQYTGVEISGAQNLIIGNVQSGGGNRIAYNIENGVGVQNYPATSSGISIRGNKISLNGALGIDLVGGTPGVTLNDTGDSDTGPNGLQNYPVITSISTSGGLITVAGTLNSLPNKTFILDFYRNSSAAHSTGYDEGEIYWAGTALSVTTNASGNASFSFTVAGSYPRQYITATATNTTTDDTSEFSLSKVVPALTLGISPSTFSEGAGSGAATGTVTRNVVTASALTVTITSSDTGEAYPVTTTVTIPANSASATFSVGATDDAIVDGPQSVTFTASATGLVPATKVVTVTDDD